MPRTILLLQVVGFRWHSKKHICSLALLGTACYHGPKAGDSRTRCRQQNSRGRILATAVNLLCVFVSGAAAADAELDFGYLDTGPYLVAPWNSDPLVTLRASNGSVAMQAVQAVQPGRRRVLRPVLGSPQGEQWSPGNMRDMLPPPLHRKVLPRVRSGQEE